MQSAVILAGGNSSRLGTDKSLLVFGGKPLICQTVEKLRLVADEVIIVARSKDHAENLEKLDIDRAVFAWDSIEGFGPVAGLDAGMECARGDLVFATGCDLPFLNLKVIRKLFDLAQKEVNYDAIVPLRPNGYVEPLHSVYNRGKLLSACKRALKRNERRIRAPLGELRINSVPIELLQPLDNELLTFFNLNTPTDLEKARRLWTEDRR